MNGVGVAPGRASRREIMILFRKIISSLVPRKELVTISTSEKYPQNYCREKLKEKGNDTPHGLREEALAYLARKDKNRAPPLSGLAPSNGRPSPTFYCPHRSIVSQQISKTPPPPSGAA